jgi:cleavage and polyadenylation specificity factor subunit 1
MLNFTVTQPHHNRGYSQTRLSGAKSLTTSTTLATPRPSPLDGVPAVCVPGSGKRLPRNGTRLYTLPTIQGNLTRTGFSGVFQPPAARFFHVHIDLVGPMPVFSLFQYCLTAIDRYTRWPEALPLSEITPKQSLRTSSPSVLLVSTVRRKSQPTRAGNFSARLPKTLATIIGSSLTPTTAWHPISKSMTESLHGQLKAALMCHADEYWTEALPLVLIGIRSAFKVDLRKSHQWNLCTILTCGYRGKYSPPFPVECTDVTEFAPGMRVHVGKLLPVPTSRHVAPSTFIFKDLTTA